MVEKILQQLLEGQKQLFEGQQQLFDGQQQLFDGQTQIIKRLDTIENTMVTKVDFDNAMNEGQKDILAMLERTASKDSITRLDTKFDLLNNKLFQTDTEIALLKIAK